MTSETRIDSICNDLFDAYALQRSFDNWGGEGTFPRTIGLVLIRTITFCFLSRKDRRVEMFAFALPTLPQIALPNVMIFTRAGRWQWQKSDLIYLAQLAAIESIDVIN